MRVIGGEFRSRLLKSVPGTDTRPTPDRLRESLFNILAPQIEGAVFVDAFAGCGAVGIEALSRGAARAIFIELSPDACNVIRANIETLELRPRTAVWCHYVKKKLTAEPSDIVFLDPPYPDESQYAIALKLLAATPPRLAVVVQHSFRFALDPEYGPLHRYRELRQGENQLSFYRAAPPPIPE